jgi:hypothetical protein
LLLNLEAHRFISHVKGRAEIEKRLLGRVFGLNRGVGVTGGGGNCIMRSSREDEMGGVCSAHVEVRTAYRMLAGKPERRRLFGRPRNGWENSIKRDVGQVVLAVVVWVRVGSIRGRGTFL